MTRFAKIKKELVDEIETICNARCDLPDRL
jgi:hypothetical protein